MNVISSRVVLFVLVGSLAIVGIALDRFRVARVSAAERSSNVAPVFEVDPSWPKLPNNWVMGGVATVFVDPHDNVWILHRPLGVPVEMKNRAAPPVLEFDSAGKFLQAWGGLADGYDWPLKEHGITVDYKDNVWICGNAGPAATVKLRSDDMLLKFTRTGKFLFQIGGRDSSVGNNDTKNLASPADMVVYRKTNEVFVADGYVNRRIIVFDADTGAFKRMWGAFGNAPVDEPERAQALASKAGGARTPGGTRSTQEIDADKVRQQSAAFLADYGKGTAGSGSPQPPLEGPGPPQFATPHVIKISNDGFVYVGDRNNRRVQVFTIDGKYLNQVFINRTGAGSATAGGITFSPDREQRFMYVADFSNNRIVIVNRKTLEVISRFGKPGAAPGDFQDLHHIATDSKGNLYTAEVLRGNRAQRFIYKGTSPLSTQ